MIFGWEIVTVSGKLADLSAAHASVIFAIGTERKLTPQGERTTDITHH